VRHLNEVQDRAERDWSSLAASSHVRQFLALIDGEPRSATIVAEEQTEVGLLSRGDFRAQIRQNPDIALKLMKILSGRLRAAHGSPARRPDDSP